MVGLFLLALLALPVVEILVFIEVGHWLGWVPAIGILILTSMAGGALLRLQRQAVGERVQDRIRRGEPPVGELFDGLLLTVAGGLLTFPGFVTDALAVLLFLPPVRWLVKRLITARLRTSGNVVFEVRTSGPGAPPPASRGPVIDAEVIEVRDGPKLPPGPQE